MSTRPHHPFASSAATLRQALASAPREGAGRPYPRWLQLRVAAFTRAELARGGSVADTAQQLGLTPATVSRWLAASPPPASAFVPVDVVPSTTEPSRLVVHAPGGVRVEGLTVEQVAALLRSLSS